MRTRCRRRAASPKRTSPVCVRSSCWCRRTVPSPTPSVRTASRGDSLSMAAGVGRPQVGSGETTKGSGGRERAAAPQFRSHARQDDRCGGGKGTPRAAAARLLNPLRCRASIDHVRSGLKVSGRRVCRVLGQHRCTQRQVPLDRDTAVLIELVRKSILSAGSGTADQASGRRYFRTRRSRPSARIPRCPSRMATTRLSRTI